MFFIDDDIMIFINVNDLLYDKAVTVYLGMLFETISATPYTMRYNGEYHVNIHFRTKYDRNFLWDLYQDQYIKEIILLDVII